MEQNIQDEPIIKPHKIHGFNTVGLLTLVKKEVGRFINVYSQTIIAPVVTTLLFYAVFALAFGGLGRVIGEISYMEFLAPGLLMMTMVQNAFANTSSSLVIAKVQGNIVDVLMTPLSSFELYIGYMVGGVLRGMCVGLVTCIAIQFFVPIQINNILIIIIFAMLGNMLLSSLGIAAGIWSEKFDHIAAVTNFVVTPLTFLSGTFYSINQLPEMWHNIAYYNPFFYMIDGFRSGFIGQSDGNIFIGILYLLAINIVLSLLSLWMLRTGYKIKS